MTNIKKQSNRQFESSGTQQVIESTKIVDAITDALLNKKGQDIIVLDVSGLTTLTDFFVVCHGNSDVQIKALADNVEDEMKKKLGEYVWKKEGLQSRSWVILDFVNVVVHVLSKEKREFYGIERMWNDAKVTRITDEK